jgi:alkanesulfonate monooxygenase SsuD/methylene tetrahydromethanopterin reductase-like flavin-dependent oxidoreductase (luciferase family)
MGEHFSATTEPFPSPLMFLAGLVPQTRNLTFGTAVINLPNHHPAIVAAECAQFDHMSGGRFLMGVGSGGLASDFELFDIDPAARQRQFMESIDMILRIWSQDPPYDIQGEFWNVQIKTAIMPELGVGFMPKPLQKPHPPIILGGESDYTLRRVVEYCDGWFPRPGRGYEIREQLARLRRMAEEKGRDPNTLSTSVFRAPPDKAALREYEEAGIDRAVLEIPDESPDEILRVIDRYTPLLS